jgi:hypothetical protein
MRRVKGEKGKERVVGKAARGDRVFIQQTDGLANGASPTPYQPTAGGEGGHGAAKPDSVIHRYGFLPLKISVIEQSKGDKDKDTIGYSA